MLVTKLLNCSAGLQCCPFAPQSDCRAVVEGGIPAKIWHVLQGGKCKCQCWCR